MRTSAGRTSGHCAHCSCVQTNPLPGKTVTCDVWPTNPLLHGPWGWMARNVAAVVVDGLSGGVFCVFLGSTVSLDVCGVLGVYGGPGVYDVLGVQGVYGVPDVYGALGVYDGPGVCGVCCCCYCSFHRWSDSLMRQFLTGRSPRRRLIWKVPPGQWGEVLPVM
jgi:hypothetical protein